MCVEVSPASERCLHRLDDELHIDELDGRTTKHKFAVRRDTLAYQKALELTERQSAAQEQARARLFATPAENAKTVLS